MKYPIFILIVALFLLKPVFVFADCNQVGVTVVFINGMFTPSESDAINNVTKLWAEYDRRGKNTNIVFKLGYNPSHIGGIGDAYNAVTQAYVGGYMDYDLTNILKQVHNDLKTQKILLVGHSQGTFYTNAAYDYLVANGVDKNSIAVYNVATPADVVEGGGNYLTSSTDKVISSIVAKLTSIGFARQPLAANINLPLSESEQSNLLGGHSFSDVYLAEAPDKIIGDIDSALNKLQSSSQSKTDCFIEPATTISYRIKDIGYWLADGSVAIVQQVPGYVYQGVQTVTDFTLQAWQTVKNSDLVKNYNPFGGSLLNAFDNPNPTTDTTISSGIQSISSNISTLSPILSPQDILDNQNELLDLLNPQVAVITANNNLNTVNQTQNNSLNIVPVTPVPTVIALATTNTPPATTQTYTSNGGGGSVVYPKILINEIQIASIFDEKDEFVELYNPNNFSVDLTKWDLLRKTKGGANYEFYASQGSFNGKIILAKGYFLIGREGSFYGSSSDITTVKSLGDYAPDAGSQLALRNPNNEIVDLVGWGQAQDYETAPTVVPPKGQSVARIWDSLNSTSQDTNNNFIDFAIQDPTPKAQNITITTLDATCSVTPNPSKVNSNVNFFVAPTGGNGTYIYNWAGDCSAQTQTCVTSFAATGNYSSNILVTSGTQTKNLDCPVTIVSAPGPLSVSCSASPNPTQINTEVTFTPTVSGGSEAYEYYWGGDCLSQTQDCKQTFTTASTYKASITVVSGDQTQAADCSVVVTLAPPPPTDNVAPTAVFSLSPTQSSLDFSANFLLTDLSTEVVSPSGLAAFKTRTQQGDSGTWQEGNWSTISNAPTTYNGKIDIYGGQDETNYYFQVMAKDMNNNESIWLPSTPATTKIRLNKTVLINEIQIDSIVGTGGTDDDWVELYNPNNVDVSLQGWSIQKTASLTPCSIVSGFYKKNFDDNAIIPAHGFYLVVGTKANVDLLAKANMTIGWSLTANNTIYLVNNTEAVSAANDPNIVDMVGYGTACYSETTPAIAPAEGSSIERTPTGQDTQNNFNDFKQSAEATPGAKPVKVYVQDTTAYNGFLGDLSGCPDYLLKVKWSSKSQISFYQVQYNRNNLGWADWLNQTQLTEKDFWGANPSALEPAMYSLLNDNNMQFRVRAQDTNGNLGDWTNLNFDLSNPVVINEIALFGTDYFSSPSNKNQWVELYNKSQNLIDLTGWQLISGSSGQLKTTTLSGIIPANGYYLLQKNDGTFLDVTVNQNLSDSLFISGDLRLVNSQNRFIDNFYIPLGNGWGESDFSKIDDQGQIHYYSLERVSPYGLGIDPKNWKQNDGIITNGTDGGNFKVYGTPGQRNSDYLLYTPIWQNFNEYTVLPKIMRDSQNVSPYLFHNNGNSGVIVLPPATLKIDPGVTIQFSDSDGGINVQGVLDAQGTSDQPIVFTTSRQTTDQGQGNWGGIWFQNSDPNPQISTSKIDNVFITFAGNTSAGQYGDQSGSFGAGIRTDDGISLSVKNSVIEQSVIGMWLVNPGLGTVIDSVLFLENNTVQKSGGGRALWIDGGTLNWPEVTNCSGTHDDDGFGVYLSKFNDISPVPNIDENTKTNLGVFAEP